MLQYALFGEPTEIKPRVSRVRAGSAKRKYTKCRTRRLSLATLTREEEAKRRQVDIEDLLEPLPPRPRTRAECAGVPRPCPYVGCRHHTYLDCDPETGAITLNFPDVEPDEMPADCSCALDVADELARTRSELDCEQLAKYFNVTGERVRQILVGALHGTPALAKLARVEREPN